MRKKNLKFADLPTRFNFRSICGVIRMIKIYFLILSNFGGGEFRSTMVFGFLKFFKLE